MEPWHGLILAAASLAGAGCGFLSTRWGVTWAARRQGAEPRGATATTPADPVDTADYLETLATFGETVTPVWSGHIEACQRQMDDAVTELTARFNGIVELLDTVLASSRYGVVAETGKVFDLSRLQLGEVVSTLQTALEYKRQVVEDLRALLTLNEDMRAMTAEVSRIASQTHLLALNAAIEASHIGTAGAAFAVVAMEVRQLANQSGQAAQRIESRTEDINSAISSVCSTAEEKVQVEGRAVAEANAKVQAVLEDLMHLVEGLRDSSEQLGDAAEGIREQIGTSIVQFQFQDRISQVLSHLRDSIAQLPAVLDPSAGAERARPAELLVRLSESYTTVEEHLTHASGTPAEVRESVVTFF